MYMSMHVYVYACICLCMHVFMYVCLSVYKMHIDPLLINQHVKGEVPEGASALGCHGWPPPWLPSPRAVLLG